jgi:hypothetical protein
MGLQGRGARHDELRAVIELKPTLKEGDAYVDRPAYAGADEKEVSIRVFNPKPIAASLSGAKPVVARFIRTPLRWMKPDGKGGLVPK